MGREGIAEDAGAGRQGRGQDLCARGQAGGPGPRALAGPRRAPAIEREAGDPGGGFPWPWGTGARQRAPLGARPSPAGPLGRGPACVDAEPARGGKGGRVCAPDGARAGAVRAGLLGRRGRLLWRVRPRRVQTPCPTRGGGRSPPRPLELGRARRVGPGGRRLDLRQEQLAMTLYAPRTAPAARLRRQSAGPARGGGPRGAQTPPPPPKRAAAGRRDLPVSTAATPRRRRATARECALRAGLLHQRPACITSSTDGDSPADSIPCAFALERFDFIQSHLGDSQIVW